MIVTLELTDDVEQAIERRARRLGISSSEYLRRMAERAVRPTSPTTRPAKAGLRASKPPKAKSEAGHTKTGAEVLDELDALNLPPGYGDPAVDSPELARQLRERFSRRDHSREQAGQ
jgi:hypothetical protein